MARPNTDGRRGEDASPQDKVVAGVELGGTKAIAVLARGRTILDMTRVPTEAPHDTLSALHEQLKRWRDRHAIAALGIASFGPVDLDPRSRTYGHVLATPKPGWAGADIVRALQPAVEAPAAFDTDVAGAALAEGLWGAATECTSHAYVTVGTGVGGSLLCRGSSAHGANHPEFGHIRIRRREGDDFPGICPFHGDCVEGLASGPAIAARTGRSAESLPVDHPVWWDVAHTIGELIVALLCVAAPDKVLLGGGVMQDKDFFLEMIRDRVTSSSAGYLPATSCEALRTRIAAPALGPLAGPLGAIAIAHRVFGNEASFCLR